MSSKKLKTLGMPKYVAAGSHTFNQEKMRFMVMERFGTDLQKKFVDCNRQFSRKTVILLAMQIVSILILSTGFVVNTVHYGSCVSAAVPLSSVVLLSDRHSAIYSQ